MNAGRVGELLRFRTRDGDETTVYLVRHPVAHARVSVACFTAPERLDHWCAATGPQEAMVAGFFLRDPHRPLGEVRIGGVPVSHEPVPEPWRAARACVHVDGTVRLAPRGELAAEPTRDLGKPARCSSTTVTSASRHGDREGFSAVSARFDSDITVGRYPRCALGVGDDELLAVCCDGRRSGSTTRAWSWESSRG